MFCTQRAGHGYVRAKANPYLGVYEKGSCQHSFAVRFCLWKKYGDAMVEKGNTAAHGTTHVLNQKLVRQCCIGHSFVNCEEDVGLRQVKRSYKPELLLKKYVVSEV